MKTIVHSTWGLTSDYDCDRQVTVRVDHYSKDKTKGIDIVLVAEPVKPDLIKSLMNESTWEFYDYVLTHNLELLERNPKAIFHNQHATWINDYNFPDKRFGVTNVISGRGARMKEGVSMRQELWARQNEIIIPKTFYLSTRVAYPLGDSTKNPTLYESKNPLFETMFHIALECTSVNWYFSEKLLDCFQTMTVPIYYGCHDIGSFFNPKGFFQCWTVDEIIEVCNKLTEKEYQIRAKAMRDNYKLAQEYRSHTQILDTKLKQLCE